MDMSAVSGLASPAVEFDADGYVVGVDNSTLAVATAPGLLSFSPLRPCAFGHVVIVIGEAQDTYP